MFSVRQKLKFLMLFVWPLCLEKLNEIFMNTFYARALSCIKVIKYVLSHTPHCL